MRGIARCGRCGHGLRSLTGKQRQDGTLPRSYVCASHIANRGKAQCPAVPLNAHIAEVILITSLPTLLERPEDAPPDQHDPMGAGSYEWLGRYTEHSQRHSRELADIRRLQAG